MRFLLINNHCISDPTAGVTHSLRTIMEWLSDAGHECRILTTARFESGVTFTIDEHLRQQGVDVAAAVPAPRGRRQAGQRRSAADPAPVVHYAVRTVPAGLSVFRMGADGMLTLARTYDIDVGDRALRITAYDQ